MEHTYTGDNSDNAIEIVIEKDLEKGFDYRKITIGQEAV